MFEQLPGVTPQIAAALTSLKDELSAAAGKNLAGLILYGGLARGRYRPGKSDINIVVLLHEAGANALAAITPALRAARRSAKITPMILTPAEVRPAAVVFPTKFLDIKNHHVVLHGEDAFTGLEVPREQIRLRIVQELRNLTLRVRRRFVEVQGDRTLETTMLAELARPLAIEVAALLGLAGKPAPADDRSAAIFAAAAAALDLDGPALAQLAGLRHHEQLGGDAQPLVQSLLVTLARLIERAERL